MEWAADESPLRTSTDINIIWRPRLPQGLPPPGELVLTCFQHKDQKKKKKKQALKELDGRALYPLSRRPTRDPPSPVRASTCARPVYLAIHFFPQPMTAPVAHSAFPPDGLLDGLLWNLWGRIDDPVSSSAIGVFPAVSSLFSYRSKLETVPLWPRGRRDVASPSFVPDF